MGVPPDTAAAPAFVEQTVGDITVSGNTRTDAGRIVRSFDVPAGIRFSRDAVSRGIVKLSALGLFADVWVESRPRGDGVVDLVIHVIELPRISRIEFTGNRHLETEDLDRRLMLRVGEAMAPGPIRAQVDSLLRHYRAEGYPLAKVEAVQDTGGGAGVLRFVVQEGEKVRVTRILFEGAPSFPEKKLRKALKTKQKGFFGGGDVDEVQFLEDHGRIESYYRDRGHRDARVLGHDLRPGETPRKLTLVFRVDEGPRYRVGEVAWTGNTVIGTATMRRYWQPKPDELYSRARIERAQGQAYADYAEEGYLYLAVEPRETLRDSIVDVTFEVTEGRPSRVRMVHITGNKATREKVIRRELDVREGDRFKRSALMRSQGDLMRLGFFEEVLPDFTPAESTDVDITFRVKEKTVGTASAGAGYTGETGITGFIEIGHNNVLGNGQSLQLHLERGARRSNYSLSFTEPWFRDTPTLLGFSVFSFRRELDLYREERIGGSVRIGRPLAWPDFSRGSLGYSLEDVTIEQLQDTLSATDSLTLGGIALGRAVRTSSLTGTFLRNSADHPLYPTRGSRFSITSELAGGPFGGSVSFHKHRFENRVWLPSLLRGVSTMLRARVGVLSTYPGEDRPIPIYERFRLGGGTTPDPLRGYDDYMVVPGKFIRDVVSGALTTRVRYPGGRFMTLYTVEQQFAVVHPLHGVVFFDAGNTWDEWWEIHPFDLKLGAGIGFRMEIPLLGIIGFDYGYGFDRDDGAKAVGHFLIGQTSF